MQSIDPRANKGPRVTPSDAKQELWPLMGYALREELSRPVLTEADALADLAGEPRPS